MTPVLEIISQKELPGWLLLKNAGIGRAEGMGQRISGFDAHFWETSFEAILAHIPKPVLLNNKEARELASWRFSDEEIAEGRFSFDTQPNALMNEGNDKDVFGESWSVFWAVPADKDLIIKYVCDALVELAGDGKINESHIEQVWNSRVSRMFIAHNDDLDGFALMEIHQAVDEELIEAVNQLPCAPDESAWEVLEDDFPWDDEDDFA
ncbi:MAG: hypothetical protein KDC13_02850 [Bacteroidetes bacterium]|nr:hypothetical protein [Bacteroidota bacterium]